MRGKDVVLDGMEVTYPNGFTAVHPTDLTIQAGEFFSILGPSGCGKTTILRAVSGFLDPSAGRILIGGADQRGIGPNARPTALIFQNLALFPLMSVRENVAFGLEARGMGRRARLAKADGLLDLVALGDQGDKKPTELSGGQRQRVAIAQALMQRPKILCMDEPFSALDAGTRENLQLFLLELWEELQMTVFFVTHDLDEAAYLGTRLIALSQYYTDDRTDPARRGAKIVFDRKLPREGALSPSVKADPAFAALVQEIRMEAFDPEYRQHLREFDLTHPSSFRTVGDGELREP